MNECSICLSIIVDDNICTTSCYHKFCYSCLNEWFDNRKITCPMCRTNIRSYEYNNQNTRIIYIENTERREQPIVDLDMMIINRRIYKSLQITSMLSVFWGLTNIYLLITCNDH